MNARIADDARFALLAKVRQARMMSGEERMVAGIQMFAGVCERMKEGIRDENPAADGGKVHSLLLQRLAKIRRLTKQTKTVP
jgi:nicotinate-nucleotide pyrophosphorylase